MKQTARIVASLVFASVVVTNRADTVNHGDALIKWLRSNGGFVSPKLEIRTASDPNDPNARNGVFTTGDLKDNELIIALPPESIISSKTRAKEELAPKTPQAKESQLNVGDRVDGFFLPEEAWYPGVLAAVNSDGTFDIEYDDGDEDKGLLAEHIRPSQPDEDDFCLTARNLVREMELGVRSNFAPYAIYLSQQKTGQLPSAWSDAGKEMLIRVLGQNEELQPILPPLTPFRHANDWRIGCGGKDDSFGENAYMMLIQRGWDDLLLPVYDMMNHHNGKKLNTKSSNSVHDVHRGADIEVRASRDVVAGEELCLSYYFCEDCGARLEYYGTPDVLRDYGFVEEFPQRWIFDQQSFEVAFDLDRNESGELDLSWIRGEPSEEGVIFLQEQLSRLKDIDDSELEAPESELEIVRAYHQSLMTAISHALRGDDGKTCENVEGECDA